MEQLLQNYNQAVTQHMIWEQKRLRSFNTVELNNMIDTELEYLQNRIDQLLQQIQKP